MNPPGKIKQRYTDKISAESLIRDLERQLKNERNGQAAFEDLWNKQSRFLLNNFVKNSAVSSDLFFGALTKEKALAGDEEFFDSS